jgi:hypothetical protein
MPDTNSIDELAAFWDVHDLCDFEAELEDVNEPVFVRQLGERESKGPQNDE